MKIIFKKSQICLIWGQSDIPGLSDRPAQSNRRVSPGQTSAKLDQSWTTFSQFTLVEFTAQLSQSSNLVLSLMCAQDAISA